MWKWKEDERRSGKREGKLGTGKRAFGRAALKISVVVSPTVDFTSASLPIQRAVSACQNCTRRRWFNPVQPTAN